MSEPDDNGLDVTRYGRIAGNPSINATIHHCFKYISEEDKRKSVKKFREQPHGEDQVMHTFRELVLGAFLGANGFNVKYDYTMEGRTPDWTVLDCELHPACVIELSNFHLDRRRENQIRERWRTGGIWSGWLGSHEDRLYNVIQSKASAYKGLVNRHAVPYVIAIFGAFEAAVEISEVRGCLFHVETGLFGLYPEVSGVLFFQENPGCYEFEYIVSPNALRPAHFPGGRFGLGRETKRPERGLVQNVPD